MKPFGYVTLAIFLASLTAFSAETRIWTSRKGTNVEAQLVRVDGRQVILLTEDNREVKLTAEDLSLADRQYLVEFGDADPELVESGEVGAPELAVRVDSKTFKKGDKPFTLGEGEAALNFEVLETEHFVIGTDGVRPNAIAETAERLWHGMAFEHMNFRVDWGTKRRLILMVENRENFKKLGDWYLAYLAQRKVDNGVQQRIAATWTRVGSNEIYLTDELMEAWNLHDTVTVFNIEDEDRYKDDMESFPVHVIAGDLLGQQMGGVSDYGSNGYFAMLTGFAYYKEIKLTKKTETNLLSAEGTDFAEITEKRGFEDGTSWARTLRGLVKRGKVTPDFEKMLGWEGADLDAEKLVLIYSFACYCNSTPKRLAGFARTVRRIESSDQIPEPIEFARLMGFDSVEALQKDWTEYVSSTEFK